MSNPSLVWIAYAPPGVVSSGPSVITAPRVVLDYLDMDWRVVGPYRLDTAEDEAS